MPQWKGVYFYVRLDPARDTLSLEALHVLAELPTLLFLAIYSQQLLTWAKSFHIGRGAAGTYHFFVWRAVIAGNVAAWALQIALWSVRGAAPTALDAAALSLAAAALNAASFLVIAACLASYGARLAADIATVPLGLDLRASGVTALVRINTVLSVAFLVRVVAVLIISWVAYADFNGFDEEFDGGDVALSLCFFLLTELVPLSAILWWNRPIARRAKRSAPLVSRGARSPRSPASPGAIAASLHANRFSPGTGGSDGATAFGVVRGGDGSDAAADRFGSVEMRAAQSRTSVGGAVWALLQIAFFGVAAVGATTPKSQDERTALIARPAAGAASSGGSSLESDGASGSLEAARAASTYNAAAIP